MDEDEFPVAIPPLPVELTEESAADWKEQAVAAIRDDVKRNTLCNCEVEIELTLVADADMASGAQLSVWVGHGNACKAMNEQAGIMRRN